MRYGFCRAVEWGGDVTLALQGADIDAKHVEGGSVLTEFSGEGWADLIKQVMLRRAVR
jgi:hypothetical protein